MQTPSVDEIVELAMEVDKGDPTDFGMLSINEKDSYRLVALSLLENKMLTDPEIGNTILLATLTKIIVDNMILNIKLLEAAQLAKGKIKIH